jgi:hypothetical protein
MLCCRLELKYDGTKSGMDAFEDQINEFLRYVKIATDTSLRDTLSDPTKSRDFLSDPSESGPTKQYGTVVTNFRERWGAIGDPLLFEAIPIKQFFLVWLLSASAWQYCV